MQSNFPSDKPDNEESKKTKSFDLSNDELKKYAGRPEFVTRADGKKFPTDYQLSEEEVEEFFNLMKPVMDFVDKKAIPFCAFSQFANSVTDALYAFDALMPGARCGDTIYFMGKLGALVFGKEKPFGADKVRQLYQIALMMRDGLNPNNGGNKNG